MDIRTKAVHTGVYKDNSYNSVITPLYPSSTFYFDALGKNKGYDYTRSGNPTRAALEENVAALESGVAASATSTGMSAITAIMMALKPGDHVVTGDDIYGGTYRLFDAVLSQRGIEFSFVNMRDLDAVKNAIKDNTKMIWVETPSNPLLNIIDMQGVFDLAPEGCMKAVDNTFLSPYFQSPFEHGADVIVHSTTKYINGHSDVVGGIIIYNCEQCAEQGKYLVNALGVSQSPYDAWLTLRGVKTLGPRMEQHQENAIKLAEFLEAHDRVSKVYYPGLASHPQQDLIKKQMKGFGGMLSFEIDPKADLNKFFNSLQYFALAESLGGIESLIEHPYSMSHASMGEAGLKASGITEQTIRVSVGIEGADDLIADLKAALESC